MSEAVLEPSPKHPIDLPRDYEFAEQLDQGLIDVEVSEATLASLNMLAYDLGEAGATISPAELLSISRRQDAQEEYHGLEPLNGIQALAAFEYLQDAGVIDKHTNADHEAKVLKAKTDDGNDKPRTDKVLEDATYFNAQSTKKPKPEYDIVTTLPLTKQEIKTLKRQRRQDRNQASLRRGAQNLKGSVKGTKRLFGRGKQSTGGMRQEFQENFVGETVSDDDRQQAFDRARQEQADRNWQRHRRTRLVPIDMPTNHLTGLEPPAMTPLEEIAVNKTKKLINSEQLLLVDYRQRLQPEIQQVYDKYQDALESSGISFYSEISVDPQYDYLFADDNLKLLEARLVENLQNAIVQMRAHNGGQPLGEAELTDIHDSVFNEELRAYAKQGEQDAPQDVIDQLEQRFREFRDKQDHDKDLWHQAQNDVFEHYFGDSMAQKWAIMLKLQEAADNERNMAERLRRAAQQAGRGATAGATTGHPEAGPRLEHEEMFSNENIDAFTDEVTQAVADAYRTEKAQTSTNRLDKDRSAEIQDEVLDRLAREYAARYIDNPSDNIIEDVKQAEIKHKFNKSQSGKGRSNRGRRRGNT